MENSPWNKKDISLNKKTLSEKEFETNVDTNKIKSTVKNNEIKAKELLFSFPNLDKQVVSFFETNALVDGSINISHIQPRSNFFKKDGMCFDDGKRITTRGYNYICSLDTSLTSMQKIKKYREIIYSTVESLNDNKLDKIEKLLLLDYLKNSLITILNSFVYQEKLGLPNIDTSKEYENIRSELMGNIEAVIQCSVDFILNKELNEIYTINFGNLLSVTNNTIDELIKYHSEYRLPSFYVSRPEITHPLAIIGASLLCAERYKKVDAVVGVPSGGTEFAFTVKVFMNKLGKNNIRLVLLPMSLHSLKQFSGISSNANTQIQSNIKKYLGVDTNSILICDDNTSTGRTLQFLKDLILDTYQDIEIHCSVVEADLIRSRIDKNNSRRTHVANKDVYSDSVNILPISKKISPKVDLIEMIEKRKIISYYKNMEQKSLNVVDKIYAKAMVSANELGVDYSHFTEENAVLDFRGTFLSNFFITTVELNGKTYPSVEHAYQAAKFHTTDWNGLQEKVKVEIQETLKLRGYAATVVYDNNLFADKKMTAGNIKIIANILRKYEYVDKEWEDKRIKIMINLLLQKFKKKEMLSKLKETKEKKLIEENTWNDTLWGVCDGKGRNLLGIILMEIRKLKQDT